MNGKQVIRTAAAPSPRHAFSQGVSKAGLLQVSGQGPQDPATGDYLAPGDVRAQTRITLDNIAGILRAGGASFEDVVMVRVYLTSRADFAAMNEAYDAYLSAAVESGELPSRTTVMVGLPHPDMLVEIDALAVLG